MSSDELTQQAYCLSRDPATPGRARILHRSGEHMHANPDPYLESLRLYGGQAQWDVLNQILPPECPLVVWDVGLGAAANAFAIMNSIEEHRREHPHFHRPIILESFELDLSSLNLALAHCDEFPYLRPEIVKDLIQKGEVTPSPSFHWKLRLGNYFETREQAPSPHVVLFDPFSYKTNRHFWTRESFSWLFKKSQPQPCQLLTYSTSTAVRTGLLEAGFWLGSGLGSGPKSDSTLAWNESWISALRHADPSGNLFVDLKKILLGQKWFEKWTISGAKNSLRDDPFPSSTRDPEQIYRGVEEHPQFQKEFYL